MAEQTTAEDWDDDLKPERFTKVRDDPRTVAEIAAHTVEKHPIELEEPIDTLSSPLIIECACPGWQHREWPPKSAYPDGNLPENYEEGGIRYPAVPCSIEDQSEAIVEAIVEGCAGAHIHPRDPADCLATNWVDLLAEVYDDIFAQTDAVSIQHSWNRTPDGSIDYITGAEERLAAADGSNKYLQGALVLWPPADRYSKYYQREVREGVRYYLDNDIKPVHKIRGPYDRRKLHQDIVEPGIVDDDGPLIVIHEMGHPYGWPMDHDPWPAVDMAHEIQQSKELFPDDTVYGVYSGSRNWLPVTMMAVLMGVDMVRIGIEDCYWMYPHKDEVIQRNIDCIGKITDFCRSIERELATPEQAREIMGIELT